MEKLRNSLYQHVEVLAEEISERSIGSYSRLEKAADYIHDSLEELGYSVREQVYKMQQDYRNVIAEVPGTAADKEIIVVGAHYDTVIGTPGADDNASGVAALLELARMCKNVRFKRTVRFVAFSLEEPPVFRTEFMGSRVYARRARQIGENIVAMLCLESVGFYTDVEGSQDYPLPLMSLFYPKQGNFVAVVGNFGSRDLVNKVEGNIKESCQVPVETLVSPSIVPGVDFSDHASFWEEDYPAVMITDTAMYRNPNYHRITDTIKTLDFETLSELVKGLFYTIRSLDD